MKKIFKILMMIASIVICALLYVALQIELYRVSYSIQKKTQALVQVQDSFEKARVSLFKLKALDILEKRIQQSDMELGLPSEVKTVEVELPETNIPILPVETGKSPFSLLQFVREAQAKIVSPDKN